MSQKRECFIIYVCDCAVIVYFLLNTVCLTFEWSIWLSICNIECPFVSLIYCGWWHNHRRLVRCLASWSRYSQWIEGFLRSGCSNQWIIGVHFGILTRMGQSIIFSRMPHDWWLRIICTVFLPLLLCKIHHFGIFQLSCIPGHFFPVIMRLRKSHDCGGGAFRMARRLVSRLEL